MNNKEINYQNNWQKMKRKDNKMQEWTKYKNMYKKKSKDKKK